MSAPSIPAPVKTTAALGLGLAGIGLTAVGFLVDNHLTVVTSWLVGITFWTGIALGALPGIANVQAKCPNGRESNWELDDNERTWSAELHAAAGSVVRVPLPGRNATPAYPRTRSGRVHR